VSDFAYDLTKFRHLLDKFVELMREKHGEDNALVKEYIELKEDTQLTDHRRSLESRLWELLHRPKSIAPQDYDLTTKFRNRFYKGLRIRDYTDEEIEYIINNELKERALCNNRTTK